MELLGINPCTIPEKALRREQKRNKKYVTFSGAKVAMQVVCGTQTRIIHSDILDRDWFDPNARTSEHTSRPIRLLERLDSVVGPGVMNGQGFPTSRKENAVQISESLSLSDIAEGRYDALFEKADEKPSELYRSAQNPPPGPAVRLITSTPFQPEVFVLPQYPQMAKIAHMTGTVDFKVGIDADGGTTDITFESGAPLLQMAVKDAVRTWKFPKDASGKQVQAAIDFQCNVVRK
jgi:TonB family protein